jgi:probable F420-dependent oxidoreductase
MKFAVNYPIIQHPVPGELFTGAALMEFARTAERAGFDGVGFTEHPAPSHKWLTNGGHDAFDPYVALSFVAAVTERVRLIPNIVVLPYRNPLLAAKTIATLDVLSGGRFTLATATGYLRSEYRALGVDFDARNDLFDEAIEVMQGVWGGDEYAYEGSGFTASSVSANPKPVGHVPIWIGGNSKLARRRVAAVGDGWTPFFAPAMLSGTAKTPVLENVDQLAAMLDELWQYCDEAGRSRDDIDVQFGLPTRGTPGTKDFDVAGHLADLDELAQLGVTWTGVGVSGESLAAALECLEAYGETVIKPSRG